MGIIATICNAQREAMRRRPSAADIAMRVFEDALRREIGEMARESFEELVFHDAGSRDLCRWADDGGFQP